MLLSQVVKVSGTGLVLECLRGGRGGGVARSIASGHKPSALGCRGGGPPTGDDEL